MNAGIGKGEEPAAAARKKRGAGEERKGRRGRARAGPGVALLPSSSRKRSFEQGGRGRAAADDVGRKRSDVG